MTAPNIINVTSIVGKTVTNAVTTSLTTLVDNPPNSNKVLKINTLYVANINGNASADISVGLYTDTTITPLIIRYLARTVTVPADTTVLVLGRDGPIYLEEGARLVVSGSIVNYLDVICSYEEIT
jgi:hypothetical protein